VVNQHRAIEGAGDDGFLVAAEIITKLGGIAVFVQQGNRIFSS